MLQASREPPFTARILGETMTTLRETIEQKLSSAFNPDRIKVINESHLHAGHQPDITGKGETHMRVQIVSESFNDKSRVARHRAIHEILQAEIDAGLHALAIEASAPGEPNRIKD
jgi:BolA protein